VVGFGESARNQRPRPHSGLLPVFDNFIRRGRKARS